MQTPKLFTLLPEEYVATPDGMTIDRDGNLILSCPNQIRASRPAGVVHDIEVAVGTEFEPH